MTHSSPIREVLSTLARHSDLIEHCLGEVVSPNDGVTNASALIALRGVSALRPVGDEGYRLNPRLRDYLHEYMQLYPAMQSLADIGAKTSMIVALWSSMLDSQGDRETLDHLMLEMRTTVLDIGDAMDRNMVLLQTLISTRYGNVRTLLAKKAQNRWYQKRTSDLAADLTRLARAADTVESEASTRGSDTLATFLQRHLVSRMTSWNQGITEIHTFLRAELFKLRDIERDMRLLARTDMLLRQQPSWRGIEVSMEGVLPDFLLAARLGPMKAHAEPLDTDPQAALEVQALAKSLPPKTKPKVSEPPQRYTVVKDEPAPKPMAPAMRALGKLARDARASTDGISLIEWRNKDVDAQSMPARIWLVMALAALQAAKLEVSVVLNPSRPDERFAHTFRDAVVRGRGAATRRQGLP